MVGYVLQKGLWKKRKRLQYELISSPPLDAKLRFEKELRIQELAQAIDDLTGNYLSEHTRKDNDKCQMTNAK